MTRPLLSFMKLFPEFRAPSWDGWREVLAALTGDIRELYAAVGRGAGKSRIAALLGCWYATRAYRLVPGERVYVGIFAPDKRQAGVTFRYLRGLLQSVPELAALIVSETRESVELRTGVVIEVIAANLAAPRGRAYALAILEEAAFLRSEDSANPDVELVRAIRPALARVPGSLLVVISSPYARRGILYAALERQAKTPSPDVLVVQRPTTALNPTFDAAAIARAYAEDPVAAAAEYGAEFRSDVEDFLSVPAIDAVTIPGRLELAPSSRLAYRAFLDFAGGSGSDSAVLAVGHRDPTRDRAVLDCVREVRPPFSPDAVCREFAETCRRYGVSQARADRWGGQFPVERMAALGVHVAPAEHTRSDLYRELLPLVMSGRVELLDVPRLRTQLLGLERRTARGGRDAIDHGPGGHDDVANAVAGVLVACAARPRSTFGLAFSPWL
jgi:hypothetical protein